MTKELSPTIEKLANSIHENYAIKEKMEATIKKISEGIRDQEKELAELLDNEGFAVGSKIKLENGRTISVKEFFSASIPSNSKINSEKDPEKAQELMDRKESCHEWLDENGLGGIIKNQIIISLDRGENEKAKLIMEELATKDLMVTKEEIVNHMTLNATLKEQMKKGVNVPFEKFSVQTGTVVDIK